MAKRETEILSDEDDDDFDPDNNAQIRICTGCYGSGLSRYAAHKECPDCYGDGWVWWD